MEEKFKLDISSLNSCAVSDPEAVFSVWGHHFRSTFTASRCKYMINNECNKGEGVELVFSGSWIRENFLYNTWFIHGYWIPGLYSDIGYLVPTWILDTWFPGY